MSTGKINYRSDVLGLSEIPKAKKILFPKVR